MYQLTIRSVRNHSISLALLLAMASCFSSQKQKEHEIRIAASSTPHAEMLEQIRGDLEREGITLKIVQVDDYMLPNRLLAEKQVDANFFQHEPFLRQQMEASGWDLSILNRVHVEPMGIYSKKIHDLRSLTPRSVIAIPSDPTNESRALLLLQKARIIRLVEKPDGSIYSKEDVVENEFCCILKTVDAAMLPRVLSDVTLAVIPANFAYQVDLLPRDALIQEDPDLRYANVIVVRKGDTRPDWDSLCTWMHSEKMHQYLEKMYGNSFVLLDYSS